MTAEASERPIRGWTARRSYVRFVRDPVGALCEAYRRFGPLSVFGNMYPSRKGDQRRIIVALGPTYNRQVLGVPDAFRPIGLTIPGPRGSAQRRVRYGLPVMSGPTHKEQRELVLPPLQNKAVEGYHAGMVAIAERILAGWRAGETVDMWSQVRAFPLNMATEILFGQTDPERAHAVGHMTQAWISRSYSLAARVFPVNLPGTPYHRMLKEAETLEGEMLRLVEAKRQSGAHGDDALAILVRAQEAAGGRGPDHIVGQLAILFAASYETTVNGLAWTLFLLAQHPDVTREIVDELDAVLRGGPPTTESLGKLTLLEAAINEAMRILPPVPYTVRVATRPAEVGTLEVRRKDRIVLSHYVTHHMPDIYPNPEEYLPRRWFTINPTPYEYLPFSAGPRRCIGGFFAMSVMKITVAMILQRFRFTVVPGSRIDRVVQVTMRPKYGLPMEIHAADRQFRASPVRGNIHEMVKLGA
jgi:cytochrome P450